ncbi:MAG: HAMP domain-containing histidine kinase [Chloroflexota bacterium]|nr:HAMP domain-containing histidine kinase [Chloroflexota bacterium]
MRSFIRRLNVRLVVAIASVALVGLIVSGVAINQILPEYFRQQAVARQQTAAVSIVLLVQEIADAERENRPGVLAAPELRDAAVFGHAAHVAAGPLIPATVEIYNEQGQLAARAEPPNPGQLIRDGLQRDPEVPAYATKLIPLRISSDDGTTISYRIVLKDAYTSRQTTIQQIRGALVGAGVLALAVSVLAGILVARRLTVPINRLRRVAGQVAKGNLDERAEPSGVLEIDELAAQFNVMADRLSASLRILEADRDRLREFVADVSHELRTPIAALRTFSDLQQDGKVDAATTNEFHARSREQITRLEWLSTNLLDLSRIEAGIFPLDMGWGDLRDPIRSVVEAHAEAAEERGITLTSEVPSSAVNAHFDRERIVQLLTNLAGNALKFTPRGGEVAIRLTDAPEAATIEVADSGPGIPPNELPRIFERFYRGTNTGDARASGSGLGLAIVRSIVEMHGGSVEVESTIGSGSLFRVVLPHVVPADAAAPRPDDLHEDQ